MAEIDNTNVSKVLGRIVDYPQTYDKSVLVREPRSSNRVHLGIDDSNPPFAGFDIWNAYEVSALTSNGLPVAGIMKIVYPATNKYIVESKSLKLYLNSFNMFRAGDNTNSVLDFIEKTVTNDLNELLETNVKCTIFSTRTIVDYQLTDTSNYYNNLHSWDKYVTLEDTIDLNYNVFDKFQEEPSLLTSDFTYKKNKLVSYHSSLLKSNCRVTRQPDWGDVFIDMESKYHINLVGLAKYIVSFRDECHFHEEICETIFTRLNDLFNPSVLIVKCLYTRRGGIDICPIRYKGVDFTVAKNNYDIDRYINHFIPYCKTPRQ